MSRASGAATVRAWASITFQRLALLAGMTTTGRLGLITPAFSQAILEQLRSQHLQVVVVDRRDHRDRRRLEYIGGVETPAEADLDDAEVRWRLGEGQEGQHRGDLEEADRLALVGGLDLVDQGRKGSVGEQAAAHADALGEPHEVRRGNGVHAQPGSSWK